MEMTLVGPAVERQPRTLQWWTTICGYADLVPERGVAALVRGRHQVAVFRLADGRVHCVDNRDPYSGANVLSRGIIGTRGDRPTVASPMFKQVFDLATGAALDDLSVRITVHQVRLRDGLVEICL